MSKTELRIFLASPGGLESERDAIEQLAGTLNANFSDRLNITLVVRRFEQRAARSGRAQAQINPWVDDCDILIALVHRRWGSSSGDGDQTGFSEEFGRAIERFELTGHPVVSLHFKAVDPESEADAGPQLAQVMAFRRRIETEHVALYANFDSLDGLRMNVMQLLIEEMHAASDQRQDSMESSIGSAVETRDSSVGSESRAERDSSGIAEVFETFAEVIRNGKSDHSLDIDRLTLFANGVARDQEVASIHLTNRAFNQRRTTPLSEWELTACFRAYISDHGRSGTAEDRVVPFVLAVGNEKIKTQLLDRASDFLGSDVDYVQKGYLRLLSAFRLRPETLWPLETEPASAHWLNLASSGLKMDALAYWTAVATEEDLAGARFLSTSDDSTVANFGRALTSIVDPDQSTDPLINLDAKVLVNTAINDRLGARLLARASTTALQDLMKRTYLDTDVRKAIVPEIARRGAWTVEMIKTLINFRAFVGYFGDAWEPEARELLFATGDPAVLLLLIEQSNNLKPGEALIVLAELSAVNATFRSLYAAQAPDHLTLGNIEAHFALHAHDPSHSRQANQVVAGTFEPANRMVERLRDSGAEESVLTFVQERDLASALTYLATSGSIISATAIHLIRSIAGRPGRFRYEMLMVLEEVAKDADIPTLLDSAPGRWRSDSGRLGRLLSRATLSRLNSLLDHDTSDIALGALKELARRERLPSQRVQKGLLRHPDARLRFFALSTIVPALADIAGFIDEYIHGGPTYYYNVVCELDRIASGSPTAY